MDQHDGGESFCLGACIWWAIWKARNNLVFEKTPISIQGIINDGLYMFNSYSKEVDGENELVTRNMEFSQSNHHATAWQAPPANFIEINVDAAVADDKAFPTAIARDSSGTILGAGSRIVNTTITLVAEAHGFLLAFDLARRTEAHNIIVEGDCQQVIYILQKKNNSIPWRIAHLIDEIKSKSLTLDSVEFLFVPKRVNYLAHNLADYANSIMSMLGGHLPNSLSIFRSNLLVSVLLYCC
ncbi:uncharacterized protein LOC113273002 [Papaver somniferum]|uniref:uncharacterized protein LOC113273002 n=1 Tax=Papaver somniferum TaxID=3469 RepID=UPI000E703788|nr:uncharacterized protein LOC113273002 [Papaver somniferum]